MRVIESITFAEYRALLLYSEVSVRTRFILFDIIFFSKPYDNCIKNDQRTVVVV